MNERYVDLHIHSCFSDGTMTPAEILEHAAAQSLSFIAIADHNVLEGSRQLLSLCKAAGRGCVSAVEIDCLENNRSIHVLGYCMNIEDESFIRFLKNNRELLDMISVYLIEKMSVVYPMISMSDYDRFSYDPCLGGWKALHYLVSKGLAESLRDALRYYSIFDCPYSIVDFPSVAEVCQAIHAASGFAALAHPGEVLDSADIVLFRAELRKLAAMGLDGIECFYPSHTNEITQACLVICREKGLLITAGSDCHGSFGKTSIGEIKAAMSDLNLVGLIQQ
jgi:predicted metal-dependent phosphoesterase TrpH